MKTLIITILLFVVSVIEMEGQTFFPLKVGNKYQIEHNYKSGSSGGISGSYTSFINYNKSNIISDTLIENKQFFCLNFPLPYWEQIPEQYHWYWYDSLNSRLMIKLDDDDTLRLAIDFTAPDGTIFTSYLFGYKAYFRSWGIITDTVFNKQYQSYKFQRWFTPMVEHVYYIAENFGLHLITHKWGGYTLYIDEYHRAVMAIVDNTIFNYQNASINSVTISPDRSLESIPFTILIYPSHHFQTLVDSVYTEVKVIRNDSDIVYHTYFYSTKLSNHLFYCFLDIPHHTLQVDDIVQYRVIVTDKSIFQTKAFSPDSGYHQFRILPPYPTSVSDDDIPNKLHLFQNYPNPFNNSTVISYTLAEENHISLKIYNILGEEIEVLVNQILPAGSYQTKFNAADLPGGVYICRLQAGLNNQNIKIIMLR
jgi:hypothetical protein